MARNKILVLVLLIVPLAIFFPFLGDFVFQPGSSFSDLAISHFPNALLIRQSLASGNGIPLWSPAILSGYPFAADPLSGLWYPPAWLVLVLPLPFGFNLLLMLHLFFAGAGTYLLLRNRGLRMSAALFGGLSFAFLPKLVAHYAAGHITLVYAVSWTPWLLLAAVNWEKNNKIWRFWAAPGLILGIIALADIRWAALASILWLGFGFFDRESFASHAILVGDTNLTDEMQHQSKWWLGVKIAGEFVFQICIAVLIAAPVLLPLLQYSQLSSRSALSITENFNLSLPPAKLVNLFLPDIGGYAEWILYPGILTIALAATVICNAALRKRCQFWLFSGLLALIYSLGSSIPFLSYLAIIPGFNLLRVPPRALFILGLSFAITAAYAVDYLLEGKSSSPTTSRIDPTIVLTGLSAFLIFLTAGIYFLSGSLPFGFVWGTSGMVLASVLIGLRLKKKISRNIFIGCMLVFCMVDPGVVNFLSISPRTPEQVLSEGEQAANFISQQPGIFRVYSPSYSIPQQTAARYSLQLADGVDPLQMSSYVAFMKEATGIPNDEYSVTLPPFPNGEINLDNLSYVPNAHLLGLLNVKYVVSSFNIDATGLRIIAQFGRTRVYVNDFCMPRAWLQPPAAQAEIGVSENVNLLRLSPNEIDLEATGPGLLVLSEIYYPGWQVYVDGVQQAVREDSGLFRAVDLTEGAHQVQFIFRPFLVYLGLSLAFFMGFVLVAISFVFSGNPFRKSRLNIEA